MTTSTLIIRADAEQRMGTGHVMRCIALAQGWQETGGPVVFLISPSSRPLADRIAREGFSVRYLESQPGSTGDADETHAFAAECGASWIVADGYQFGDAFLDRLVSGPVKILLIDDYGHVKHYRNAIVLNQNSYASMDLYPSHDDSVRFLLGGKYTMLRREFLAKGQARDRDLSGPVKTILVTMGGSDPDNVTTAVMEALRPLVAGTPVRVTALIGRMNPFLACGTPPGTGWENFAVRHAEREMPDLIRGADIAIIGSGSTAWETAFLGTPMIAVVLSANQAPVARKLEEAGAAVAIHDRKDIPAQLAPAVRELMASAEKRSALSGAARTLIDGEGVSRVVMAMQGGPVRLRDARVADSDLLLAWANDPVVRGNAFSSDPIPKDAHERWFSGKLASSDCRIFIAVDRDEVPVGQVRFDRDGESAEVDISVAAAARGRGLGTRILRLGTAKIIHSTDIKTIIARVKTGNTASKKIFEQAGYRCTGTAHVKGSDVYEFEFRRSFLTGKEDS